MDRHGVALPFTLVTLVTGITSFMGDLTRTDPAG
jgi:hypothetical protein